MPRGRRALRSCVRCRQTPLRLTGYCLELDSLLRLEGQIIPRDFSMFGRGSGYFVLSQSWYIFTL